MLTHLATILGYQFVYHHLWNHQFITQAFGSLKELQDTMSYQLIILMDNICVKNDFHNLIPLPVISILLRTPVSGSNYSHYHPLPVEILKH